MLLAYLKNFLQIFCSFFLQDSNAECPTIMPLKPEIVGKLFDMMETQDSIKTVSADCISVSILIKLCIP
jgi:hypothetical protein